MKTAKLACRNPIPNKAMMPSKFIEGRNERKGEKEKKQKKEEEKKKERESEPVFRPTGLPCNASTLSVVVFGNGWL
jgi:hypothetical protein